MSPISDHDADSFARFKSPGKRGRLHLDDHADDGPCPSCGQPDATGKHYTINGQDPRCWPCHQKRMGGNGTIREPGVTGKDIEQDLALERISRIGDVDGAAFALDAPAHVEAIWGQGTRVLWPRGEPTMIYGPDGVGKTAIAQQLVLRLIGIGDPELLGYPLAPVDGRVLYLALDRPQQAARSLRRMVSEEHREILHDRLAVWRGTAPFDLPGNPGGLATFAGERKAAAIVIDSLKDLTAKLSDEDSGMAVHRAWQLCVEAGIEVLTLHHPRKAQADNKKPRTLADVYGSRWVTAGCGSVILMWGDAGDPVVELAHLKQPADIVGPLTVLHDNAQGTTTAINTADVVDIVRGHIGPPPTAGDVAEVLFSNSAPSRNEVEKARRRLEAAVRDKHLTRSEIPAERGEKVAYATA